MMPQTFGSVCSGIEAASVAFNPLGWKAAWFAEIESFPCAVLAHHYPHVPNLGDMTTIRARLEAGEVQAPDVLCGGTPCQSFSVAGLRKSLGDERGNLTLEFIRIANAIDHLRRAAGRPPVWILYENVPGILSTADNAFGAFLGGLAGCESALDEPPDGWPGAGVVAGPQRVVAWRTLDAQHFGVAQRRRRVFVLALAGPRGWDCADALLPVGDRMSWHPAPRREAGQEPAGTIEASLGRSRGAGTPPGAIQAFGGNRTSGSIDITPALLAQPGSGWKGDFESETFVTHSLRGEGFDASEDGTGRGTPLVPVAHVETIPTMMNGANTPAGHNARSGHTKDNYIVPVAHSFDARQSDVLQYGDKSGPLDTDGHSVAIAFDTTQITHPENRSNPQPGGPCHPLAAGAHAPAVAFQSATEFLPQSSRVYSEGEAAPTLQATGTRNGNRAPQVHAAMQVRRLTPVEAERLQGFPDGYTAIPWRGKPADQCPDGPRYKALGNSWAVPVVRWIGEQIAKEAAC